MTMYRAYFISGPQRRAGLMDKLRLAAAGVVGLVIVGAALVLSLSLLLILVPIALVAYLFRRQIIAALFRRAGMADPMAAAAAAAAAEAEERARPAGRDASDGVTIETDYIVVDRTRPDDARR